jgi:hypothetical protein
MATRINFIDVYSFFDEMDSMMMESIMDDRNISFSIRTFGWSRFSAGHNDFFERRMAVEEDKVDYVLRLLFDAMKNGMISREGRFRA